MYNANGTNCSAELFHEWVEMELPKYEAAQKAKAEDDPTVWGSWDWSRNDPWSVFQKGLYHHQLRHVLNYFPQSQLLVLLSESFFGDPQSSFDDVLGFLDLPPYELQLKQTPTGQWVMDNILGDSSKAAKKTKNPPILPPTKRRLDYFYADEVTHHRPTLACHDDSRRDALRTFFSCAHHKESQSP